MHTRILALTLALLAMGFLSASAGEKVWVGLYLAENSPPPAGAVVAPAKMHDRLFTVFGFNHYELIKSQSIELADEWEQWAVPRKDFFIRLEPLHREPGEPKVIDYEIYKDGFIVAKGTYEPHEETPLFINGPDFRRGRLILVLEAR